MPEFVYALLALILLLALGFVVVKIVSQARMLQQLSSQVGDMLEQKHRAILTDLHGGLAQQSDRLTSRLLVLRGSDAQDVQLQEGGN